MAAGPAFESRQWRKPRTIVHPDQRSLWGFGWRGRCSAVRESGKVRRCLVPDLAMRGAEPCWPGNNGLIEERIGSRRREKVVRDRGRRRPGGEKTVVLVERMTNDVMSCRCLSWAAGR
jgi:hypothetical protein